MRRERHAGSPDRALGPRGEDSQANSSTDTTAGDRARPPPALPRARHADPRPRAAISTGERLMKNESPVRGTQKWYTYA